MQRIARFEKISYSRFLEEFKEYIEDMSDVQKEALYDSLLLPERATEGSAGYDFYMPFDEELAPGQEVKIPTGVRVKIDEGWVLMLFPRSSLGFKYRVQLNNTVGIIDSDYYTAKNDGHIWVKLTNDSRTSKTCTLEKGTAMVQGIFVPYGITEDDDVTVERTGGFGSTNRKR